MEVNNRTQHDTVQATHSTLMLINN